MRHAPVADLVKTFHGQGIACTLTPGKRRRTGLRASHRYMQGACIQRIAVMQVTIEIEAALHTVDDSDEIPGNATEIATDLLIDWLPLFEPLYVVIDRTLLTAAYFTGVEPRLVLLLELGELLTWQWHLKFGLQTTCPPQSPVLGVAAADSASSSPINSSDAGGRASTACISPDRILRRFKCASMAPR